MNRRFIHCFAFLIVLSIHCVCEAKHKKRRIVTGVNNAPATISHLDRLGKRRNLVIVQDDVNEIEGALGACTLSLLRALQAESAPIVVSSSLWFNMCIYLRCHGDEHKLKPRRKEWTVYQVSPDIYCAVPQKYLDRIGAITQDFQLVDTVRDSISGSELTRDDIALGLKCSLLKKVESPFSISWMKVLSYRLRIFGNAFALHAVFTPAALRKVLITSDEIANIDQYPAYDIFMAGHGRGASLFGSVIVGCSIPEFQSLLAFMNNNIHTHLFMYQTCFGGGQHLVKPFTREDKPELFNYAIVCCCTGAMPSSVYLDTQSKRALDFNAIFKDVADTSLSEDNFQVRLANFYPAQDEAPKKRMLHNIPSIRWPGASEFVALTGALSDPIIQVYNPLSSITDTVVINDKQAFLFYDQGIIHTPIVMKGKCSAMIPMDPCADTVIINSLDVREHSFHDVLLYCFAPISMIEAPAGTVLIKELQCKLSDNDPSVSTLRNVTIRSCRETPILETFYERQLDIKYYYNFGLRKRVTYEHNGKIYKMMVTPKHAPDYLGKILLFAEMLFATVYGFNPQVAQFSMFAHDLDPKRLWVFSKARTVRPRLAARYERDFAARYDKIAGPVSSRYQLAMSQRAGVQGIDAHCAEA